MDVTFTNGRVAIRKDLIFGLCVYCDYNGREQWYPIDHLEPEEVLDVVRLLDNNPTFPWKEELAAIVAKKKAA